jgi:peptidoglycan/LPS O-acetylase OafA/YrhL
LIYIYTGWVARSNPTGAQGVVPALLVAMAAITIAYASLKLYDEPARRWLSKKFLQRTV